MSGTVITERRRLGRMGPEVSAIGLGCMSLSGVYGTSEEEAGIALIHRAIDTLEQIGSAETWAVLGTLAKGTPNPRVAQAAAAALQRIATRTR